MLTRRKSARAASERARTAARQHDDSIADSSACAHHADCYKKRRDDLRADFVKPGSRAAQGRARNARAGAPRLGGGTLIQSGCCEGAMGVQDQRSSSRSKRAKHRPRVNLRHRPGELCQVGPGGSSGMGSLHCLKKMSIQSRDIRSRWRASISHQHVSVLLPMRVEATIVPQ